MAKTEKNYTPGDYREHSFSDPNGFVIGGWISEESCHQCGKTSVLVSENHRECLNGCGPKKLAQKFQF